MAGRPPNTALVVRLSAAGAGATSAGAAAEACAGAVSRLQEQKKALIAAERFEECAVLRDQARLA